MIREADRPSELWSLVVSGLVLACVLCSSAANVLADPPPNDECVGAEVIPGAGPFPYLTSVTQDITDATSFGDPPTPSCAISGGDSRSIWYSFTPATSGLYAFGTCAGEGLATTVDDTVLGVYTSTAGCAGPFGEIHEGCDENGCGNEDLQSAIDEVSLEAGTQYDVVVFRYGAEPPAAGNTAVQLKVDRAFPPQNDSCNQPTSLALDHPITGTTTHAGNNYQLSGAGCFGGIGQTPSNATGRDVVYRFETPSAGEYSFRVTGVEGTDPVLYLASACPAESATLIGTCLGAANRNASTLSASEEIACVSLGEGQEVFAFVDASAFGGGSTHGIEVNRCFQESAINDAPNTADLLTCPIEGSIAPAGDVDFFTLGSPIAGARIFAMADGVAAGSSDFDMRITTDLDTLEFDNAGLDVPFGAFAPLCAGTPATGVPTYVRITHSSAATISEPYRLYGSVQAPAEDATPETEANDTLAEADAAQSNYFAGTLTLGDADVFLVTPRPDPPLPLQAGTLILAVLDGDPELDASCTDARLELLSSTGAVLLSVDDAESTSTVRSPETGTLTGSSPTSCSEAFVYRVPANGAYSVRVTGSAGSSGSYLLSIALDCAATCDDGDFCTGNDFVQDGVCVGGPPPACDDGVICTIDSCEAGTCLNVPSASSCDDGIACTIDSCDGEDCQHVPDASACDDDSPCTADTCDLETGCEYAPLPGTCDDGSACTSADTCIGSGCVGAPIACDDGLFCNGTATCDPVTGCGPTVPVDCDDGSPCTIDSCDESADLCIHAPGGCDDGIACTLDSCSIDGTECLHTANHSACQDGSFCNGAESCLLGAGCTAGTPVTCQDDVDCTTDACNDSFAQCMFIAHSSLCSDGVPCSLDICNAITGCQHDFGCCDSPADCPDPPANDECVGAEVIPGAGPFPHLTSVTEDISAATEIGDPPTPSCAISGGDSRSIWYSFTPASSGLYSLATCAQEGLATTVDDTVLGVYTSTAGCSGPFAEIFAGCDEDGCEGEGLQSTIDEVSLAAGTSYDVVVFRFGAEPPVAGNTAIQLKVDRAFPPQNDSCNDPTPLLLDQPVTGTTAHAGNNYQLSGAGCFSGIGQTPSTATGREVVYWFDTPSTGEYSFRVTGVDGPDPVLYVASSCPAGSATLIGTCLGAANRNASTMSASEEVSCLGLAAGQIVFAYVDARASGAGSTHTIEVNRCLKESESNDTPGTASLLSCPVEGSIAPSGDADFFELGSPIAGARIFAMADGIAAGSSDFDMRITTDLDTLEFDDGGLDVPFGASAPACGGTPATGAPTYVRISHSSAATISEPYWLYGSVQVPAEDATPETEQNGTIAEADAAPNNYFAGALLPDDADIFRVTPRPDPPLPIQAGTLIFAALDGDPEFDTTCTDTKLELLDSTGAVLLSVDDAEATSTDRAPEAGTLTGSSPTSCSEALVYRVPVAGAYSIRVTGSAGSTGSYLLSIVLDCVASCDDGEFCTGNDFVEDGVCVGGPPPSCDDGVECTDDACDAENCVHVPNSGNCNDGNSCTTDTCDPETGCAHESISGGSCSDSVCISNGTCVDGECLGTPTDCNDGLFCNGVESCDPGTGCGPGVPVNCDDLSPCTIDSCDESANACVNAPGGCNDGIACTSDSCTQNGLTCIHTPNSAMCQDGVFCNGTEVCLSNLGCTPGVPVVCGDSIACTVNSCSESLDACLTTPVDGLCDDGDPCTTDVCDSAMGCQHEGICCDTIDPWALGYYRRLCLGIPVPPSEVLTLADVGCVNDSCAFAAVDSVADVCAVLLAPIPATVCDRAEAELMSLLLNVCRDRVCPRNPIETTCTEHGTAGELLAAADGLLCGSPTESECTDIRCALHEVNTGEALGANSLMLERLGDLVILSWEEPLHAPGEEVLAYRVLRSAGGGEWEPAAEVGATVRTWADTVESPGLRFYRVATVLTGEGP